MSSSVLFETHLHAHIPMTRHLHTHTHTHIHTAKEIDLSAVTSGLVSKFRKRDSSYRKTTTTKNKRVLTAVKRSCRFVSHCCSVNRTCLRVRNPGLCGSGSVKSCSVSLTGASEDFLPVLAFLYLILLYLCVLVEDGISAYSTLKFCNGCGETV